MAMAPAARFLISVCGTTAVLAVLMTSLLVRNGELLTTRAGVRAQFETNGIYGRSIWDDFFAYKFAAYEARPTGSISIGSSRAMAVRALLFRNQDHFSAGGAVNSVAELEAFANELAKLKKRPTVAFLYVDFEWFLAEVGRERNAAYRDRYESWLFVYQSAFVHLKDLFVNAAAPHLEIDPETGGKLIGSRAQRLRDGFRTDGSVRQSSFIRDNDLSDSDITGFIDAPESTPAQTDARAFAIKRGWWNAVFDRSKMARLERVLGFLQSLGVSLVVVLPPLMPHIAVALEERPELVFFRDWRQSLAAITRDRGVPMFDFTRLPLPSASCYGDRYHASEGAYSWMLSKIRPRLAEQSHPAAEVLDPNALGRYSNVNCLRSLPATAH